MTEIRKAQQKDAEVLVSFTQELADNKSLNKNNGFISHPFNIENIANAIVICENDIPVGMVEVRKFDNDKFSFYSQYCDSKKMIPDSLLLSTMAISRQHKGKGYGRKLVEYVINTTRGNNIFCDVAIAPFYNNASHCFFQKMGFTKEAEYTHLHKDGMIRTWALYVYENV